MRFTDMIKQRMQEEKTKESAPKSRDWLSSSGTGWGPHHDQPNPFAKMLHQVKQDAIETVGDIRDEPSEVPGRLKQRLDSYMIGGDQYYRRPQ